MSNKQFYRFSYYGRAQKGRNLLIHQLRDADAALELSSVLHDLGYRYGGLLLNYPSNESKHPTPIDDSFLRPTDLILITTRPPLDDWSDKPRSPILRSYTTLEAKIFDCLWNKYFHHCSRTEIDLVKSLAVQLPKEVADKAELVFRQYGGAFCEYYSGRKRRGQPLTTIVYMTFTKEIWPNGPGLLTAFGMGGPETLIWAHLLRSTYPHLVCSRSFVMAEMTEQVIAPGQSDLNFADRWKLKILVDIDLEPAGKRRLTQTKRK